MSHEPGFSCRVGGSGCSEAEPGEEVIKYRKRIALYSWRDARVESVPSSAEIPENLLCCARFDGASKGVNNHRTKVRWLCICRLNASRAAGG